jgi:hypothetical protein
MDLLHRCVVDPDPEAVAADVGVVVPTVQCAACVHDIAHERERCHITAAAAAAAAAAATAAATAAAAAAAAAASSIRLREMGQITLLHNSAVVLIIDSIITQKTLYRCRLRQAAGGGRGLHTRW